MRLISILLCAGTVLAQDNTVFRAASAAKAFETGRNAMIPIADPAVEQPPNPDSGRNELSSYFADTTLELGAQTHRDVARAKLGAGGPAEVHVASGARDAAEIRPVEDIEHVRAIRESNRFPDRESLQNGDVFVAEPRIAELAVVIR